MLFRSTLAASSLSTILLTAGLSLLAATSVQGQTMTQSFDTLRCDPPAFVPTSTDGLMWSNFACRSSTAASTPTNSAYLAAAVSSPNVAFNNAAQAATISRSSGVFMLNSAYLTAAWRDNLVVRVEAFRGNTSVQVQTFTLSATAACRPSSNAALVCRCVNWTASLAS